MMKGTEQTPEEELQQSQEVLRWATRKDRRDSSFTVKAMIEVADQLAKQDRWPEEVTLREQIATALRDARGAENESTVQAEWMLAFCLIRLERFDDAEPWLAHVVAGRALALGQDNPETLMAMAWKASVAKKLGRVDDAREQQEYVVQGYESAGLGESSQAMLASLNLAATLSELHEREAASRLLRHILAVRSRTLGPDDPLTAQVRTLLEHHEGPGGVEPHGGAYTL
jgi:tetratricopeptide (TPR) repeat protein